MSFFFLSKILFLIRIYNYPKAFSARIFKVPFLLALSLWSSVKSQVFPFSNSVCLFVCIPVLNCGIIVVKYSWCETHLGWSGGVGLEPWSMLLLRFQVSLSLMSIWVG